MFFLTFFMGFYKLLIVETHYLIIHLKKIRNMKIDT